MNLFTIKAVSPDLKLSDVALGSLPFVAMMLVVVGLLVAFPQIALWLPFRVGS
jgi:TRAP-type C4-dicarboxylate transport system permease large subunit